jgi:hypothetical protein
MAETLHELMEEASRALVEMRYLESEAMCLRALLMAKEQQNWTAYARIVLPLQECRRQRRMIAEDHTIQLGTAEGYSMPDKGCLVLTPPCNHEDALELDQQITERGLFVEVLLSLSEPGDAQWELTTYRGLSVSCRVDAPRNLPLNEPVRSSDIPGAGAWFVAAFEALGDEAIATVFEPMGSVERIEKLEKLIVAVGDHEKLHQALIAAAEAVTES